MKNGTEIILLALSCFALGGGWVWFVILNCLRPKWRLEDGAAAVNAHEKARARMLRSAASTRCWKSNTIPAVLHGGPFDGLPTEASAETDHMVWKDPRTGVRALYKFAARNEGGRWVFSYVRPAKAMIEDAV